MSRHTLWLARTKFKVYWRNFPRKTNEDGKIPPPITFDQFVTSAETASKMINRLFFPTEIYWEGIDPVLSGLNLKDCLLDAIQVPFANLLGAELTGADLCMTDLTGANLFKANLINANLTCAVLADSNLRCANLTGADLTGADLTRANLTGVNLTRENLTQKQVNSFFGIKAGPRMTLLRDRLSYPDHWCNTGIAATANSQVILEEYMLAWETWLDSR